MDKLAAMQAFTAVVEAKSFVQAAHRLEISTTAVSRLVAQLEDALGVRLLQRTTRRLDLTEAGSTYHQHCSRILAEIREADASIGVESMKPCGKLRIHAPNLFGSRQVRGLLHKYRTLYPEVTIELTVSAKSVDILEDIYDLAVHMGFAPGDTKVARKLAPLHLMVCASPAYIERHGMATAPMDLARHNCVTSTFADQADAWTFENEDGTVIEVPLHGNFRTNDGELLHESALAGEGIVRLPSYILEEDFRSGRLIRLLSDWTTPGMAVYAVYPSHRHVSAKVRSFVDFLLEQWPRAPL